MKYDVLLVGCLCGVDVFMAEHLSRHGLKTLVVRRTDSDQGYATDVPEGYLQAFDPDDIVYTDSGFKFLTLAHQSRLIFSTTGALVRHLRFYWFFRGLLRLPPVINLTTGSDITELAVERSLHGFLYRQYLRYVDLNWSYPMPHSLQNLMKLKVRNVVFMNGYPLIVHKPSTQKKRTPNKPKTGTTRFFHVSHLDWNYSNFAPGRNSSKGNDKFLIAFIRAVQAGLDVECVVLHRGADKDIAKQMFVRAGVENAVVWKEHLSRNELHEQMLDADVVVNMFAHGGIGSISVEAMSLGIPLMQYVNPVYFDMMYGGVMPPVVNCRTVEEIYEKIAWCCETEDLDRLGEDGRQWVDRHVAPEQSLTTFLFYFCLLTGEKRLDFGPYLKEMDDHVAAVQAGTYDPYAMIETP